jgi:mono/diheme cytochrome c family protein
MQIHRVAIVAIGVAMIGIAVGIQAAGAGDAAAGKDLYMKKCKTCHGADGQGNPGVAKLLNVTFKPLGSEEIQKKSDAEFKKIITEGKDKMKPVKDLSDADMDNIIAFVRTLKQ